MEQQAELTFGPGYSILSAKPIPFPNLPLENLPKINVR